jgi:hypothetical protein
MSLSSVSPESPRGNVQLLLVEEKDHPLSIDMGTIKPGMTFFVLSLNRTLRGIFQERLKEDFATHLKTWMDNSKEVERKSDCSVHGQYEVANERIKVAYEDWLEGKRVCLDLSGLQLRGLPPRFYQIKFFELYLDNNLFYRFPDVLLSTKIKMLLSLNGNHLVMLPQKYRWPRTLKLQNNRITALPKKVFSTVKELDVSHNCLNEEIKLPENIKTNKVNLIGNENATKLAVSLRKAYVHNVMF